MRTMGSPEARDPVVLFDGVCNLCNASVGFLLDHERGQHLSFASLQSTFGRGLAQRENAADLDSMMLLEGGKLYTRSTAILRATRYLRVPYRWGYVLLLVPQPLRDFFYNWVARHRYRWFGRTETCRIPSPELAARFIV